MFSVARRWIVPLLLLAPSSGLAAGPAACPIVMEGSAGVGRPWFAPEGGGRLYVARGGRLEVRGARDLGLSGTVEGLPGLSDMASIKGGGLGYAVFEGGVAVLDLSALKATGVVESRPSAKAFLVPDDAVKAMVVFDPNYGAVLGISTKDDRAYAQAKLPSAPQGAQAAPDGTILAMLSDPGELVRLDPASFGILKRFPLRSCDDPRGLLLDEVSGAAIVSCASFPLMSVDSATGRILGSVQAEVHPKKTQADAVRRARVGASALAFDPGSRVAASIDGFGAVVFAVLSEDGSFKGSVKAVAGGFARGIAFAGRPGEFVVSASDPSGRPFAPAPGAPAGGGGLLTLVSASSVGNSACRP